MYWNAAPEMISALVIIVILINSRDAHAMPTTRDRMFTFTLYYSLFCFLLNFASIQTVYLYLVVPRWVNMVVNTAYFALYPPVTLVFIFYILLYAFEQAPPEHRVRLKTTSAIILGSTFIYEIIVLLNFQYGWLFYLDETNKYFRGPINRISLILAIFHIIVGLIAVFQERQYLDRFFFKVVLWFPMISLGIVIVQILYLEIILTGTALAIAILSVYLNFQTRRISIDNLTQYPNRESFVSNLENLAHHNKKALVVVVSLDNFKSVNDTFGQKRGDMFIKLVADKLQELCPKGQVYRYGGDELAIIADPVNDQSVVERIANLFTFQWKVEGVASRLSASLATLELPFRADPTADPITLLDHTVRTAKNRGKGQTVDCDTMILRTIRRKSQLSDRLLQAISTDSLSLDFQPIFSLGSGNMEMAEALLRMEDGKMGTIHPVEFIPLAEELGIIGELGRWVLEKVCILLDEIRSKGKEMPVISVNFSSLQFADGNIVRDILEIVGRYRIPAGTINLEITESTFIGSSFAEALAVMESLIVHGINFHLDDFGTGYSNLSYMVNLPFKCIKLDKTLLWDVQEQNRMHHFIESLIKVVRQMDFRVIVEGVENEQQVAYLRKIGCDMVQGYYFSPPLSRIEFMKDLDGNAFHPLTKIIR